jgi:hypothetical protein
MSGVALIATAVTFMWSMTLVTGVLSQMFTRFVREVDWVDALWHACARIHQELWLFVPPGILINTVHHWHSLSPWQIFFDALALYNWWTFRNWPEENHWKKRGKKAKEAVARRGSRLVVVPAGASS